MACICSSVCDQIVGPDGTPFAQKLGLGWVIIGQVCLGQIHLDSVVICNKHVYFKMEGHQCFHPVQTVSSLRNIHSH